MAAVKMKKKSSVEMTKSPAQLKKQTKMKTKPLLQLKTKPPLEFKKKLLLLQMKKRLLPLQVKKKLLPLRSRKLPKKNKKHISKLPRLSRCSSSDQHQEMWRSRVSLVCATVSAMARPSSLNMMAVSMFPRTAHLFRDVLPPA